MIVAHIKRYGTAFMPVAALALAAISEDDLQRRVVHKFVGLQKSYGKQRFLICTTNTSSRQQSEKLSAMMEMGNPMRRRPP
jgi:hypothetical protein